MIYEDHIMYDDLRCNSVDPKDPKRVDDSLLMSQQSCLFLSVIIDKVWFGIFYDNRITL